MMKFYELGKWTLNATPNSEDPMILDLTLIAENRNEIIRDRTRVDETPEGFIGRFRGLMRALYQSPVKEQPKPQAKPPKTFEEIQKEIGA